MWGWTSPATGLCIAAGLALLVVFYFVEIRTPSPLMQMSIFRIRPFLVENAVLGVAMLAFIPFFFFASTYAQVRRRAADRRPDAGPGRGQAAGGGRLRPGRGGVLAVGREVTDLSLGAQVWYVILAGAGMGFMLSPASTDAVNRASRFSYGEATGITQTVRNYAASLGLAILGTVLVTEMRNRVTTSLTARGVPAGRAAHEASQIAQFQGGSSSTSAIPLFIRLDFAYASRSVFYAMAIFMAVAAVLAIAGLRGGRQEDRGETAQRGETSGEDTAKVSPA